MSRGIAPGAPVARFWPGEALHAPGVLKNAVLVDALYERDAAGEAVLTNLLQRRGYENLDAVRAEGRKEGTVEGRKEGIAEGIKEAVLSLYGVRFGAVPDDVAAAVEATNDVARLRRCFAQLASGSPEDFIEALRG
ncbi:MAG: hypothetical protein IT372_33410 [Polyangiaceae bacterium]|nr:hypothetical protein [Polyangiaceae bacterium]